MNTNTEKNKKAPIQEKSMWRKNNKKSANITRSQRRKERLRWLLQKMQPFLEKVQSRQHFVQVPENESQLLEIVKKYPNDTQTTLRRYNCSSCYYTCPCCARFCKRCRALMKNDPSIGQHGHDLMPYVKEVRFTKIIFMVSRCFFPATEISNYNGLVGEELIAAYNLQHNIKLLLLGKFKQPTIPASWQEFKEIHNEFIHRQQTVHISRMCRALAPLYPHSEVLYEIFKRILPEKMTRFEIMDRIEKAMTIYRKNHQNPIDLKSLDALQIANTFKK